MLLESAFYLRELQEDRACHNFTAVPLPTDDKHRTLLPARLLNTYFVPLTAKVPLLDTSSSSRNDMIS